MRTYLKHILCTLISCILLTPQISSGSIISPVNDFGKLIELINKASSYNRVGDDDDDNYNYNYNNGDDDDSYSGGGGNYGGDDDDSYGGGGGNYGDDDDNYGGGDDDDNYGGGDDDDNYGGGDDDDDYYGGGDDDDDNNEIPLDGGLSFLAVAGAGLGIKKVRDNMAKKKQNK